MAAYAALVSVMHILEQLQHHPRPPISLDKKQVESLTENITFLQVFLEDYSHVGHTNEALESRIADAAHMTEDIIESYIVDQILASNNISSMEFHQSLGKMIEDIDFIKMEVMEIKGKIETQNMLQRDPSVSAASLYYPCQDVSMVGVEDVLNEVMDKLIREKSNLQIIPVVGMGGTGKTTLVKCVYVNSLVAHHFDILVWVTVSQEYSARELLTQVLYQNNRLSEKESILMSEDELGEVLYKSLSGRRYLIVIDGIWSINTWDKVKFFFPNNNNGSRIMITTRLSSLAVCLSGCYGIKMHFLDEDVSWILLRRKVFGNDDCPPELEEVGKQIARNCSGLPLSIVVVGGLLAKSGRTREYWDFIAENLNSIVNLEDNERCLQILYMSYYKLPVHLKPCFLYMGGFREDSIIRVSCLIKLWIAEGFLKPISSKSLEETAEEYLKDLVDRNLILAHKWSSNRRIKFCKIHDLIRDLCLREAQKQNFLLVIRIKHNIPEGIEDKRRIVLQQSILKGHLPQLLYPHQSTPSVRSLISQFRLVLPGMNFRLLKVLKSADENPFGCDYSLEDISRLVSLRFIAFKVNCNQILRFPSSIGLFWNLQTLILHHSLSTTAPSEIWEMPQLRHIQFDRLELPEPPSGHLEGLDDLVLENLQSLLEIKNFKCSKEVVKRIPNIKKLGICYLGFEGGTEYCINNLGCLHKLESLRCLFYLNESKPKNFLNNFTFPHSLKKLTLEGSQLHWEDMMTKIGPLPLLQVLKLGFRSFVGPEWETIDGQFCSLKFLLIDSCSDLKSWTTESTHFPQLEHLVLLGLEDLEEIPLGIGSSATLQSIELAGCSTSAVISAKEILEEQEELGNEGLQVRVVACQHDEVLMNLVSRNFHFQILSSLKAV